MAEDTSELCLQAQFGNSLALNVEHFQSEGGSFYLSGVALDERQFRE